MFGDRQQNDHKNEKKVHKNKRCVTTLFLVFNKVYRGGWFYKTPSLG